MLLKKKKFTKKKIFLDKKLLKINLHLNLKMIILNY